METNPAFEESLEKEVVKVLEKEEQKLDEQIEYFINLDKRDLDTLREQRKEQYKEIYARRQKYVSLGHSTYTELFDQKQFFTAAKESPTVVVHFYRPSTWRCQIVDKHLQTLAPLHIGTRFVKIDVEKAPFLAEHLKIWCIPTIMLIKDGKTSHSIIGFDELGGDDFKTEDLEEILRKHEILEK